MTATRQTNPPAGETSKGERPVQASRKIGKPGVMPTRFVSELGEALDGSSGRTFVLGKRPGLAELVDAAGDEWTVHSDGHAPTLRRTGSVVTWATQWFGPAAETMTRTDAAAAWATLRHSLRRAWNGEGEPMTTPATTGRDLWLRTIRAGEPVATMSAAAQRAVRAGARQGRMQMLPAPTGRIGPVTLHEYDARFAYGALVRNLPTGEPTHRHGVDAQRWIEDHPYGHAMTWATWKAPTGWNLPGILDAGDPVGERWPMSGRGWVHSAELDLAVRHGWHVEVHEAWTWTRDGDPLRAWSDRLHALMDRHGDNPPMRAAFRAIVLHGIGSFVGRPRTVTRWGEHPPDDAIGLALMGSDRWRWTEHVPALWPETHHPEWTATVWARARRRLLEGPGGVGALHLPPGTVAAFRTDAIWTTERPSWPDDGRPGQYRKRATVRLDEWPTTAAAILTARQPQRR